MKTAHEIWSYLNEKYGTVFDDDDKPKKEAHEYVEHDHNVVIEKNCSTSVDTVFCTCQNDQSGLIGRGKLLCTLTADEDQLVRMVADEW